MPFETKWISYPDIASTMSKLGVPPATGQKLEYTLPAISSASLPVPLHDSFPIAEYLDEHYPDTPKLFPSAGAKAIVAAIQTYVEVALMNPSFPFGGPATWRILDEKSQTYFRETREQWLGMKLEDFEKTGDEKSLLSAMVGYDKILAGEKGPFVMGEIASYGDILIVAYLGWFKVVNPKLFEKMINVGEGRLKTLWNAAQGWF